MAGEDVDIPFARMQTLVDSLDEIMAEFQDAGDRTSALVDAIDQPQGRTALQSAAEDFESRWDDKRETLRRKLEDLRKRVDDTRAAWEDLDAELASKQEGAS